MAGRFLVIAVVLWTASDFSLSAADDTDAPEIVVLVEKLGASSYEVRKKTTEQLVAMGLAAEPVLEASRNHADLEIRQRVASVLSRIKANQTKRRLDAFKANPSRKTVSQLPGWDLFAGIAGYSEESMACFGRMFEAEPELFEDHPPQLLADLLAVRATRLERQFAARRKEPVSIDRLHALLIACSRPEIPVKPATANSLMKLVNGTGLATNIDKPARNQSQSRNIADHWIASCEVINPDNRLIFAMKANLKAGLIPALAILRSRAAPNQRKRYAILAVAKLGTIDNVADLEPLLKDQGTFNVPRPITRKQKNPARRPVATSRVSDCALAAIWHLHGERPQDHGFPAIQENESWVFALNQIRFESDEQREQAMKLWVDFKAARQQ